MEEELKSENKCKDCGKPAYSFRIGYMNWEEELIWHSPKHYNQCKECRKKMYKGIAEKRRTTFKKRLGLEDSK